MSKGLDTAHLEKVRRVGDKTVARCPACAEQGMDEKGQHLFIAPDGRFGCVLHPGKIGHAHRCRIFALVGKNSRGKTPGAKRVPRKPSTCRIRVIPSSREGGKIIYGRGGRPFYTYTYTKNEDEDKGGIVQSVYGEGTGKLPSAPSAALSLPSPQGGGSQEKPSAASAEERPVDANPPEPPPPPARPPRRDEYPEHQGEFDLETGYPIINGAICPF